MAEDLILVDPDDPDCPVALYRPLPTESVAEVLELLDSLELISDQPREVLLDPDPMPSASGADWISAKLRGLSS